MASRRTPAPAKPGGRRAVHLHSVPSTGALDELATTAPAEAPPVPPPPPPPADSANKPLSLTDAVRLGTYLDILKATRAELAELVEHSGGQAKLAALKQLSAVAKEIQDQEEPTGGVPAPGSPGSVVADTDDDNFDPYA